MSTPPGRKLISFQGYKGFVEQLRENEILVLEYKSDERHVSLMPILLPVHFRKVGYIKGQAIIGFWAIERLDWETIPKTRKIAPNVEEFVGRTSVRRPVEDIVFAAIVRNVSAWEYLTGSVNWTTREFA